MTTNTMTIGITIESGKRTPFNVDYSYGGYPHTKININGAWVTKDEVAVIIKAILTSSLETWAEAKAKSRSVDPTPKPLSRTVQ